VGHPVSPPKPSLCATRPCPLCPARSQCIAWRLFEEYGWKAGLYQTRVWLETVGVEGVRRILGEAGRDRA